MNTELLKKYAVLKSQAKELDVKIKAIYPDVLAEVRSITNDQTDQPIEIEGVGSITLSTYPKSWEYPQHILDLQTQVDDMISLAKASGEAVKIDGYKAIFHSFK